MQRKNEIEEVVIKVVNYIYQLTALKLGDLQIKLKFFFSLSLWKVNKKDLLIN